MELHISQNGRQYGPYSEEQVKECLASGTLHSTDLAWHEGAKDWLPLSSYSDLLRLVPSPHLSIPSSQIEAAVDSSDLSPRALGSYVITTLQPNEKPLFKTAPHWIIFVRRTLYILVISFLWITYAPRLITFLGPQSSDMHQLEMLLPPLLLSTIILLSAFNNYLSSALVVTNWRVLIKFGFISRRTLEMFICKIESVVVRQGILGRLFDYGTVTIRGASGSTESFKTIAHPAEFRKCVLRVQGNM